jgi:prepilin-type N-terminal cleavage/methylation domain-containing protein
MNAAPGIAFRSAPSLADSRLYSSDLSGGGTRVARPSCVLEIASIDAFTLLELLVVVALIALLAGGVGLALRQPGESVSLQSAQATLSATLEATRARAALSQQDARCVIAADPSDSGTYLRYFRIVVPDPANSSNWLEDRDGVLLPPGVFVVPPASADVPGNPAWPASRRSTALSSAAQSMTVNGVRVAPAYCVQFTSRGTTGGSGYLLVTAGRFTNGAATASLVLDDPDNLRGVLIRSSGSLTLVNDASGL